MVSANHTEYKSGKLNASGTKKPSLKVLSLKTNQKCGSPNDQTLKS